MSKTEKNLNKIKSLKNVPFPSLFVNLKPLSDSVNLWLKWN